MANGLRGHQSAVVTAGQAVRQASAKSSTTFLEVVPGGGKSRCVPLMYDAMGRGNRRGLIWIAPRRILQSQSVDASLEGIDGRGARGLHIAPDLRSYSKDVHQGFATNYANLAVNVAEHIKAAQTMRNPLVAADEVHHLKVDTDSVTEPGWSRAFRLFDEAFDDQVHRLFMSGTPFRSDSFPIYGASYLEHGMGADDDTWHWQLDRNARGVTHIRYPRGLGIQENAVLRIRPFWFDGPVSFDREGKGPMSFNSLIAAEQAAVELKDKTIATAAKETFLNPWVSSVHKPIITRAYNDVVKYREDYPGAQLIVTLTRQEHCEHMAEWFTNTFGEASVVACADTPGAAESVERFRAGEANVLFTVAMAYEGMDAPRATHLVHLGGYRSLGWLMQCLARVWRYGPSDWRADRMCHLYAPADSRMQEACAAIGLQGEDVDPSTPPKLSDPEVTPQNTDRVQIDARRAARVVVDVDPVSKGEAKLAGASVPAFIPGNSAVTHVQQGADF